MPIATQAAGVRCICLIIIQLDGGVLKMKEANHRAPLSKVCLPDWGVLDLSPLSSLFCGIHHPPHHLCSISHTHTQSYVSSRAATTEHNRQQWTLVHSPPHQSPRWFIHNYKTAEIPPTLTSWKTSDSLRFFSTPDMLRPPTHRLATHLTRLAPTLPHPPLFFSSLPSPPPPFSFFSS